MTDINNKVEQVEDTEVVAEHEASTYQEHLGNLFEGAELSEEAKESLTTLFEAAVGYETEKKVEEIKARLEEEKDEEIRERDEVLRDQADRYLSYVVEQWTEKNKPALQNQVKMDLMESFISGLRKLFLEHNFNVPETQLDLVESLQKEVETLKSDIQTLVHKNATVSEELDNTRRELAFKELSEGMTALDAEKFRGLVEGKTYASVKEFKRGASLIKESYFKEKKAQPVVEEVVQKEKTEDQTVASIASLLGRANRLY